MSESTIPSLARRRWLGWLCNFIGHSYTFRCTSVPNFELWACRRCNRYERRGEVSVDE